MPWWICVSCWTGSSASLPAGMFRRRPWRGGPGARIRVVRFSSVEDGSRLGGGRRAAGSCLPHWAPSPFASFPGAGVVMPNVSGSRHHGEERPESTHLPHHLCLFSSNLVCLSNVLKFCSAGRVQFHLTFQNTSLLYRPELSLAKSYSTPSVFLWDHLYLSIHSQSKLGGHTSILAGAESEGQPSFTSLKLRTSDSYKLHISEQIDSFWFTLCCQ